MMKKYQIIDTVWAVSASFPKEDREHFIIINATESQAWACFLAQVGKAVLFKYSTRMASKG